MVSLGSAKCYPPFAAGPELTAVVAVVAARRVGEGAALGRVEVTTPALEATSSLEGDGGSVSKTLLLEKACPHAHLRCYSGHTLSHISLGCTGARLRPSHASTASSPGTSRCCCSTWVRTATGPRRGRQRRATASRAQRPPVLGLTPGRV